MVLGISGVVWNLRLVHTRSSCPFGLWVDDECMEPLCFWRPSVYTGLNAFAEILRTESQSYKEVLTGPLFYD